MPYYLAKSQAVKPVKHQVKHKCKRFAWAAHTLSPRKIKGSKTSKASSKAQMQAKLRQRIPYRLANRWQ
jgi:hypothetical protein